jgi:acyl carrier protein
MRSRGLAIILSLAAIGGCEDRSKSVAVASPSPAYPAPSQSNVEAVRGLAGQILGVPTEQIHVNKPLAAYNADELDAVELVMEVEDHFGVGISDETLEKLAGTMDAELTKRLTVTHLAQAAANSPPPQQKKTNPTTTTTGRAS